RRLNRAFAQWAFARADRARYQHAGRTECFFDDTQIEVNGSSFEGAAMNSEGNLALSWQVLLCGPFVADQILGATSDTKESPASDQAGKDVSRRLPELLEANAPLWLKAESCLSTDSASSAGKHLETLAQPFGAWSVSYNQWTGPLEKKAEELPALAWSSVQNVKWRDGSEHTAQYAWFRHQPAGCEAPQRFAVVRHRPAGEMFWRHAFLTANEQEGPAQLAFERHRLKGDKERVLSELLSDLDWHHPPCANLNANRRFYTLAVLAWNVLQALKRLHLPASEAPKRMRTLLRHLLLIPVELKRHARGLKACLYAPAGWVAWWRGLLTELLPRCRAMNPVLASGSG
ncbi:MAG: transposase, partial [Methyloceanibacter sp.]